MGLSLTHAIPIPVRKARFSVPVSWRDAAGALTNPTAPDTEVSVDGGANWTEAAEEVSPTAGHGYITLSGAEMDNRSVMIQCKGTGVLTEVFAVTPQDLPILRSATAQAGGATSITLDSAASTVDDYYNGCIVRTTGGTGGGGTGGANNQARVITDYVGSTRVATVTTWETQPSSDTTFDILVPIGWHQAPGTRALLALPAVAPDSSGGLATEDANGNLNADLVYVHGSALTEAGGAGRLAAAISTYGDVGTPLFTAAAAMRGTDGAITSLSGVATEANQTAILARLGAWTGTARNTILGAFQALFRKDADATVPSDVNADLGSGVGGATNTTDSAEALRDRGDAAWITATGFATAANLGTPVALDGGAATIAAMLVKLADDSGGSAYEAVADSMHTKTGSGLSAQQTRDAMKLAPTTGTPAAGSIDAHLDGFTAELLAAGWGAILATLDATTLAAAIGSSKSVTRPRGDTRSLSVAVTSGGVAYNLTGCTVKLAVGDAPNCAWADAIAKWTSGTPGTGEGTITVASPATGIATVVFGSAQVTALTASDVRFYTLQVITAAGVTMPIASGRWITSETVL